MQERRNQFVKVLAQIEKISNKLYNDSDDTLSSLVVDESDLSIRKLGQLHSELRDLQQDKDDRLNHVLDIYSLCKVLGLDFETTVAKVHPSLGVDFEGKKSLTNKTIMGLTSTIQRLRNVTIKRVQRFKEKTNAAIIIQTHWRRHKAYSSYRRLQKAAIIFQYSWRRIVAWKELGKFKMAEGSKLQLSICERPGLVPLVVNPNKLLLILNKHYQGHFAQARGKGGPPVDLHGSDRPTRYYEALLSIYSLPSEASSSSHQALSFSRRWSAVALWEICGGEVVPGTQIQTELLD
ncbi:microtubule-associated protein 65-9 [Actinidia rufa]|uniref:Microtubule-associated protein 65-9 n=1 Tax=Actinidia rufa TaxID=165716 RepID=A0A7J0FAJ0_9ERIC|nr:microtubule-associated protein 65-9 [Actinidia rufa]